MKATIHPQQKLWQRELELIAEDNDFLLSLLASLQDERIITHKYDDKTRIFFNHFQYFFNQTRHLKEGLELMDKQETKSGNRYGYLKEEINCLIDKFEVFKTNFKSFLGSLTVQKAVVTSY